MIDYKIFTIKSIDYLCNYIKDNHLNSLVLGISGGIDSTVVAAIASESCKKCNIPLIGRSLPAHTNNPEEINTAALVGEAFCSDFKEASIERMYTRVANEIELDEKIKLTPLQRGNIKARLRMIYLYNLASVHNGCVLDTDNRTEHELGFWTIHGDVGDLNCGLIYLWKTEVYELANYLLKELDIKMQDTYKDYNNNLAEEQYEALSESIKLIPTDGNGVMAGGDCAQFGLDNYGQVDDVLKTMYYTEYTRKDENPNDTWLGEHKHNDEYIRLIDSYNEQGVDKVMILHQNSKFKRERLPIFPTKEELEI